MFRRLNVQDAISYLDRVKERLSSKPNSYSEFLDIMKDLNDRDISDESLPIFVERVKLLFADCPDLVMGFNNFLPPKFAISQMENHTHSNAVAADAEIFYVETFPRSSPSIEETIRAAEIVHEKKCPEIRQTTLNDFDSVKHFINKVKLKFISHPDVFKQFMRILNSYLTNNPENSEDFDALTTVREQIERLVRNDELLTGDVDDILKRAFRSKKHLVEYIEQYFTDLEATFLLGNVDRKDSFSPSNVTANDKKRPLVDDFNDDKYNKRRKEGSLDDGGTEHGVYQAALNGSYDEYAFFDKVRALLNEEDVYKNFLRCLYLFNVNLITKTELMQLSLSFIGKYPEIVKWMKKFLDCDELNGYTEIMDFIDVDVAKRPDSLTFEIDYASCKKRGTSYRELPSNYIPPKCSGRTSLCDEVLNSSCVSFPSWQSEESSVGSSKKTPQEECIYRTEDERFELDIVIEVNKAAILALEVVQKRMNRMNVNDAKNFQLDENIGGRSKFLQERAIKRVYGDKAGDIIDGLIRNPFVAVPLVLNRLRAKAFEWKEAQNRFNVVWREQNEKAYSKTLEMQCNIFKHNDAKFIKSKNLLNEIEILFNERKQAKKQNLVRQLDDSLLDVVYPRDWTIFNDVNELLCVFMNRQNAFPKSETNTCAVKFLKRTLPSLLNAQFQFSMNFDNDNETSSDHSDGSHSLAAVKRFVATPSTLPRRRSKRISVDVHNFEKAQKKLPDKYLLYLPSSWYLFLRTHHTLAERLSKLNTLAERANVCERFGVQNSAMIAELSKPQNLQKSWPKDAYPLLLRHVKSLLTGTVDSSRFEDLMRDVFAADSCLIFTVDKLIQNCVKQLQFIISEDISLKSLTLFDHYLSKKYVSLSAKRSADAKYFREASRIFEGQNCFKTCFYPDTKKISFEMLPPVDEHVSNEVDFRNSLKWQMYVDSFLNDDTWTSAVSTTPVFLKRNLGSLRSKQTEDTAKKSTSDFFENQLKNCIVHENTEVLLTNGRKRTFHYVAGLGDYFYRRGSLSKATETFLKGVSKRNRQFCTWHEDWMINNVSVEDARLLADWFISGTASSDVDPNSSKKVIRRLTNQCNRRPPFRVITRYVSATSVRLPIINVATEVT